MKVKSEQLNPQPAANALALWSALFMLVLWLLANIGIYTSAAEQMSKWHVFFDLSLAGLIGGMIEAAIISLVGVYVFTWIYNLST